MIEISNDLNYTMPIRILAGAGRGRFGAGDMPAKREENRIERLV